MFEGCLVEIRMIRMILEEGYMGGTTCQCEIVRYDEEKERIYLLLLSADLPAISLDGTYECKITDGGETIMCTGRIIERFLDKNGKEMVFQIENGFYKNNLN